MSHAQSIYTIKIACVFLLPCFKEVSRLKLTLLYCIQKEKILLYRHNAALSVEVASLHHPISPGAGVRVGVPGLLFNPQCRFGQDRAEPAGNVHANMVDLVGVLADPTWSICIRLVF